MSLPSREHSAPTPSKWSLLVLIGVVFGYAWLTLPPDREAAGFAIPAHPERISSVPVYEARFVSHETTPSVHAATLVECLDGTLRAFWYGGTREGAADVKIYSSRFDPGTGRWSRESPILTAVDVRISLGRYVRKLGNPVAARDREGNLWLFFVSVSAGGWSGSAVNLTVSTDGGRTWAPPRRLVTSPFLNLSTLVKGPPLLLRDGTMAVPAYHELIGIFGELLWLDRQGDVVGKSRLSRGTYSLQPVVVPATPEKALALMRYRGSPPRRVVSVATTDGGRRWSPPRKLDLPNPDAALACTRLDDGALLLVFNDSETGREDLSLAWSDDEGKTWRIVHRFEHGARGEYEFSYPYLIRSRSGDLHLLYTWHRTHIKHIHFNPSWVEQKMR